MIEDSELINSYFRLLGEWGNTKLAAEGCCISVATGRQLEAKYPERLEEAMFVYRESLREEVIKRIRDPEQYSERLLLKELEMVDHRYRTKVEVQHNHSVELVGRLQRAKERMLRNVLPENGVEKVGGMQEARTLSLEARADNRAPNMADYLEDDEPKRSVGEIIEAEFSEI